MNQPIDLTRYKNKLYLELCLDMVEDAYHYSQAGVYDLMEQQLRDILETFDHVNNNDQEQAPEMKDTVVSCQNS